MLREMISDLNVKHHSLYGVTWDLSIRDTHPAYFSCFYRYKETEKGNGAKALREVLDLADQFGLAIELFAQEQKDTPGKLVSYYEQFEFVKTGQYWGDHNRYPIMIRPAQTYPVH